MRSRAPKSNRPSDLDLRRQYEVDGLSCREIAVPLGCDPTTVRAWLVAAGVTIRPRGHNNRFRPGQASAFQGHRHTPEARTKIGEATCDRWTRPAMLNRKHWLKGAAPERNPRWLGGVTPERQEFYRSPEWKAACVIVWRQANGCCERCGADSRGVDRSAGAFHVHHVVSFKVRELRADTRNLVLLCRDCHLWVHSSANADGAFIAADAEDLLRYLREAENQVLTPKLFDFLDEEEAA